MLSSARNDGLQVRPSCHAWPSAQPSRERIQPTGEQDHLVRREACRFLEWKFEVAGPQTGTSLRDRNSISYSSSERKLSVSTNAEATGMEDHSSRRRTGITNRSFRRQRIPICASAGPPRGIALSAA